VETRRKGATWNTYACRGGELDWRDGVVNWIYLDQDRDNLRPSVKNTVTNIWVKNAGKFSSSS